MLLAQEILVGPSSYPTEEIGANARAFRQLGLGYANLGAYLMSNGLSYDSDEGRAIAGAITSLMTGRAYAQSARVARASARTSATRRTASPTIRVMGMHRDAAYELSDERCTDADLLAAARTAWDDAVELGQDTATATRRRRCSRRPARSRSSWTATRRASSPTSRS